MQPIHPCDWPDIVDRSDDRWQAEQAARRNHVDCLNGLPATGYTIITTPIREYAAIAGDAVVEIQHIDHVKAVVFAPVAGDYRIHVADIYCKDDGWLIVFDRYRRHTGDRLRATGVGALRQAIDFTAHTLDILYPDESDHEYQRD